MIADMPRPRFPYLHRYKTRHGKFYWYVRRPGSGRVRIRAEFGTQAFEQQYLAAVEKPQTVPQKPAQPTNTLEWLWARYRETGHWTGKKAPTRRQRENIMAHVLKTGGQDDYREISPQDILKGRDRRAHVPSQAKGFLVCMRAMFRWAKQAEMVKVDPTVGITAFPKVKGEGFPVWTDDDVDAYLSHWPIGTKERVWIDVLLYTGLRRGDAVKLGKQHVRDGIFSIRTEKSQDETVVTSRILPVLAATLAAGPCADLAFICGASGKPLTKESFGNMFRAACNAAGVKKSAHGIRKAAATCAADNGATESELEALFGWHGGGMASLYTRAANRKKAALKASPLMDRGSMCQPNNQVGTTLKKAK